MAGKYTKGDLTEILGGLEKHPEDGRIVFAPNDRDVVLPLLRLNLIDAAIIPASPEESRDFLIKTSSVNWKRLQTVMKYDQAEQFFAREGRFFDFASGKRLTPEEEGQIPLTVKTSFGKLLDFMDPPHTRPPGGSFRNLVNGMADRLLTASPKSQWGEKLVYGLGEWLEEAVPRRQTTLMVFWTKKDGEDEAPVPALHVDQGITAHISGYTPLEYLVGGVTQAQWQVLRRGQNGGKLLIERDDPEVASRIRSLNPGDMVVFGEKFIHRSSSRATETGELNFAASPSGQWALDTDLEP